MVALKDRRYKGINRYIDCACGRCGEKLLERNQWGGFRKYIKGHNMRGDLHPFYGRKLPEKQKQSLMASITGEKSIHWAGDNVKNKGLHKWVRKYLPKPELCEICGKNPPTDLANITGIYNREFKNWGYFCHRCHLDYDNIIIRNLKPYWFGKGENKPKKKNIN